MSKRDLKRLQSLLLKERKGLKKKLGKLEKVDFGDDVDHGEEEADEAEEMVIDRALTVLFEKRLNGVNVALAKISAGTYGICENCGKDISVKLLKVDPESKLCQACKIENG